ncbi:cyclic nucleotide-binding domain-containing protein [Luteimonas sp. MC1782]|jgi:CBS domain-containing protein|uniref:putative nucleotidyltransferase substrate binding domain-containing protein n=1 Tax=Luteimonas sp. MC1782 TaxID=2760305 RepID=UPI001603C2ED|nr:putative nucleotidyltransferase substrate binding domain-containing protein [Luteimonas sp. MC1782]MBB1473393.1 cyclic nucleotide-binding domain-containing protein [Luteimonas sp. MC1782]
MDPVPGLDLSLPPFDLLDDAGRRRLQASVDIGFHPGGTTLIEAGKPSPHVFIILKGLVHAFQVDDRGREERFADYGPGDVIGAWAVMAGRARLSYRTEGDCLSHLVPADTFRQLLADNPGVAAYFNEGLATKGRLSSGSERREAAELMVIRVGEADLAPPERVDATTSIAEASARLRERRVDCLVVYDRAHDTPGIVTRTDLLEALTEQRLPLDAPIGPLASRPLATIGTGEVLFQALIDMTEREIERVVVTEGSRIAGTLGMAEVLAHFASHSHLISLRLARARDIDAIADAASGMTRLVRSLNVNGTRIPYMMELVSALNSRIMARIFELIVPVEQRDRICLLVMGSEGRREQLLKTDQDNALVLADDLDWPGLDEAMDRFSAALAKVGYPPCPGRVMVDNPHWRMRAAEWRGRIGQWKHVHGGQGALDLSIALDARPIAGNVALFAPVKDALMALGDDGILLHHLAAATLEFATPLTFFGRVRNDGAGTDIKKGGVFPVVHGLRCLALRHGIRATASRERCAALVECGELSPALGRDLPQALNVFQHMRLDAQFAALADGRVADNHIDPARLRRLDRELLRDALHVVKDFRAHVGQSFHLRD